jgi:trigger factor
VAYEVEVKAIKKRTVPELNDDFAKELGPTRAWPTWKPASASTWPTASAAAWKAKPRTGSSRRSPSATPFPVPESLVQEQIDARLERGLRALAAQGMDTEQMRKLDFARLRTAQRDGAIAEVKTTHPAGPHREEENITVSDEELDRELQMAALQSREPLDTLRCD